MGAVVGLHLAPRSFLPMKAQEELVLVAGKGIVGDRYEKGEGFYSDRPEEGRQVTLFEVETLEALERDHRIRMTMGDHRRNITTRDVPLNHLVGRRFRIGGALLEATRLATPCRHIEQITGLEVFTPLLNRSGLHARILIGGTVRMGDVVEILT
ncbi:molybdenum cofactor biosysynthesis protein [Tistrella bauzanensis]|uniref:Molybdenum cofactor biosysynthesis protein n=1 Tax=Tistrella bauzanensis TaxID=657419 RepID=A0ABQ1IZD2_9PROT|nr:MOSC domain-containing protein [Tistrella bauzanensis]GGB54804.1 molybdenum cofactor biosysynthesis protein [Tistrella bauzanensis]